MEGEIIQLGGPHHKICACGCHTEFYGRRNQKFVDTLHKANINNEKRARRNKPLAEIFSQMSNNLRILMKYYPRSKGEAILYSPLLKEGFNPNAPCLMIKDTDTGLEYRFLANYCFRQTENNKEIFIHKKKDENTTK